MSDETASETTSHSSSLEKVTDHNLAKFDSQVIRTIRLVTYSEMNRIERLPIRDRPILEFQDGSDIIKTSGFEEIDSRQEAADFDFADDRTFIAGYDECYKIYDAIWRNMDRENNLINQRISWAILLTAGFLTAQSFILSRVLVIVSSGSIPHKSVFVGISVAFAFCSVLSGLAFLFCWRTRHGVNAAQRQLKYLKRRYLRLKVGKRGLFQDVMRLPRPFGNDQDHSSGNSAAKAFPFIMSIIWAAFGIIELAGSFIIYEFRSQRILLYIWT